MKIKKLLSSALVLVMLFTTLIAVVPTSANAAYELNASTAALSAEQIKEISTKTLDYNFSSAEEMLLYELDPNGDGDLSDGYLDSVHAPDGRYSIYVNRYNGIMYYVNNVTGQILTSNPYNVNSTSTVSIDNRRLLMSQININYLLNSTNYEEPSLNSNEWAADRAQISTSFINGGIRVSYTLGDTTSRFLLPGRILAEDYEALILVPMLNDIEALLNQYCGPLNSSFNFSIFDNDKYKPYSYGCLDSGIISRYLQAMQSEYQKLLTDRNSPEYKAIHTLRNDIMSMVTAYALKNPRVYEETDRTDSNAYLGIIKDFYTPVGDEKLEIYDEDSELYHAPMYVYDGVSTSEMRVDSIMFQRYCPTYTFSMMLEHEKECGYVSKTEQKPVFRCALEYSLNADGTLSVRLPASSISFDETVYTLLSIVPIQFFGAGYLDNDGYIFFPDGSGTVVEFEEFKSMQIKMPKVSIYGLDYCYSNLISTQAYRAQITMPVYGVVADTAANPLTKSLYGVDTVKNGYFAILEEGASLAYLEFVGGGGAYKYANAYSLFSPYPSDIFDLTETAGASVGSQNSYTIVSDSRYNESYVTRITMLADEKIASTAYPEGGCYLSSYVGMAACYRDYLYGTGVLTALEQVSDDIPLYIEALGAMDITTKILSFPVTQTIPLTTFEDILRMYNEISDNASTFLKKAEEYDKLSEEANEDSLKETYAQTAENYRALAATAEKITNINFRLSGFSNGGMYFTYPTKVRWEKACGGKREFKKLVEEAKKISQTAGTSFGVYPDFDFMYINNTEMFDGISIRGNVSRMVDNRYASKQVYNSVLQDYVTYYSLVVNSVSLDDIYTKFQKKYSKFEASGISVSTMGSDLNSNFDEDEPVNRTDSEAYVVSVLNKMKNEAGLDIMVDKGNAYTLKYASHILDAAIDSSHYRYSSYPVPFVGMVLHGSKSYAGTPLNYSGTPMYDILRSVESGANPYYVLCAQNSAYLKDDHLLSEYYGVDYNTWYDSIIETYNLLNSYIGDLQDYKIVDHRLVIGERVIDAGETAANYIALKDEIVELLDAQIAKAISDKFAALQAGGAAPGIEISFVFDTDALMNQLTSVLNKSREELDNDTSFVAAINAVYDKYRAEYPAPASPNPDGVISFGTIEYTSKYNYITDSLGTDENYEHTDYTSDINNIVLVTYSNGTDTVRFILNYNIYSVNVNLGDGNVYTLEKYGCVRLD
ncbi:MAG: hypothetical protein J6L90_03015 [Clostridia bacterium]|nr:hypothetical protein [Clostridia bacterium]